MHVFQLIWCDWHRLAGLTDMNRFAEGVLCHLFRSLQADHRLRCSWNYQRRVYARNLQGRSIGWQANDAAKGEGIATLTSFCGKLSAFPALSAWYHGCPMTLYGCSTFTLASFYSKWLQFTSFYIIKLHLCSSADRSETAGCTQRRWEHFSKQRMNLEMAL